MNDLILPVKDVFDKYNFYIPPYQRGYKWTTSDIEKLLVDVCKNFSLDKKLHYRVEELSKVELTKDSSVKDYCLQFLTLQSDTQIPNKKIVIDGQQRLTTLSVLLSYLHMQDKVAGKLVYAIANKEKTRRFLEEQIFNRAIFLKLGQQPDLVWEDFLSQAIDCDYDNEDNYHLFNAAVTMQRSGLENDHRFTNLLLERVVLIVPDLGEIEGAQTFLNFNGNKMALTRTDLIKAIFLTRLARLDGHATPLQVQEQRIKMGMEWDEMVVWWNSEEVKSFFSLDFEEFLLVVKRFLDPSDKEDLLDFYESRCDEDTYRQIRVCYLMFHEWYTQTDSYNWIGLIRNRRGSGDLPFSIIAFLKNSWIQLNKKQFLKLIKKLYIGLVFGDLEVEELGKQNNAGTPMDHTYVLNLTLRKQESLALSDFYDKAEMQKQAHEILLMMSVLNTSNGVEHRFPFYKFREEQWSLEHIFPQTPVDVLNDPQAKSYQGMISYVNRLIEYYSGDQNKLRREQDKISVEWISDWQLIKHLPGNNTEFDRIQRAEKVSKINIALESFYKTIRIHSLGNLLLVTKKDNSRLSNKFYLEKRNEVLKMAHEKEFIPAHTLHVFTKQAELEYTDDLALWTRNDIYTNASYIETFLNQLINDLNGQN